MLLENRVALVTGGGGDLGRAYSVGLAGEGAAVVVNDIDGAKAEAVAQEIRAAGGQATAWQADVTDRRQVEAMIQGTVESYKRLDILCNHAGVSGDVRVVDMSEEQWDRVIRVNLKGSFLVAQSGARQMLQQGSGSLIFTVSSIGVRGRVGGAHYAASKGGMIALLRSLAAELKGTGVRVNGVVPGATDTAMSRAWRDPAEHARLVATGEVGQPDEIVGTVIFLASDLSRHVQGQVIFKNYWG